jgi:hypothetical protein
LPLNDGLFGTAFQEFQARMLMPWLFICESKLIFF